MPNWKKVIVSGSDASLNSLAVTQNVTATSFTGSLSGNATNVTGTVAIGNGGTGATTTAAARTNLGATTVGGNLITLTNPSAITFLRVNANNTVDALNAANFRTAIGAGTSSTTGTVTSVAASAGTGITITGSPITTSGTLTITNSAPHIATNLGITAGTTAGPIVTSSTGTNATLPTASGTASGVVTTGAQTWAGVKTFSSTIAGSISGTSANVTGTVAIGNGGTGQTSYTNGQLLIGNTTGNTLTKATLTQGTGITITNGTGTITVTNSSPNATHTGDVTGGTALTIANNAVTNAKAADMAVSTIKGRVTAGTGDPQDLSAGQVRTLLNVANGAQVNVATNLGITAGTTAGPIVTSSTGTNATLPTASGTASGVVTTGAQTWAGTKTFSNAIRHGSVDFLELTGTDVKYTGNANGGSVALRFDDLVASNFTIFIPNATGTVALTNEVVLLTGAQTIAGNKTFSSAIGVNKAILSNQENLDVDSGALRVIATLASATFDAAFFDFIIKKGTNRRAGTVFAVHNGTIVEFTETSTNDIGNTQEVVLSCDLSGGNIRLLASTQTNDWIIKTLVRGI